jgi:hypothetical protein
MLIAVLQLVQQLVESIEIDYCSVGGSLSPVQLVKSFHVSTAVEV